MLYFLFIEDKKGKLGYSGKEFYSKVGADSAANDYPGITHVIEAETLLEAKRKWRDKLFKKGNTEALYRNVRNMKDEDT